MSYKSIHSGQAIDKAISTVNNDLMDNTQYDFQGTFKAKDLGINETNATVLFDKFNCEHGDNINVDIRYYSNTSGIDQTKSYNFSVNNNTKIFNPLYLLNSDIRICIHKNVIYAYLSGTYLLQYSCKLDIKLKNSSNPKYRLSSSILPTTVVTTEKEQSLTEEQQLIALDNLGLIETKYNRISEEYSFSGQDIKNVNYMVCDTTQIPMNNNSFGVQLYYKSSDGLIQTIITKNIVINNGNYDYTVFYTNSNGGTVSICAHQGRLWAKSNSASFDNDKFSVIIVEAYSAHAVSESKLPNSVIKTTPQILFKSEKEQALTNLGIERINSLLLPNKIGLTEGVSTSKEIAQFTIESSLSQNIPYLEVKKSDIFTSAYYYDESIAAKISNRPNSLSGDGYTYTALEVDGRDVAIKAENGMFDGLRPRFRRITASDELSKYDHTIECMRTDGGQINLTLPANPQEGQCYEIWKWGTCAILLKGNGKNIIRVGISEGGSIGIGTEWVGIIKLVFRGNKTNVNNWLMTLHRTE